ncbi:P-loop containing nucleoside triphosphate hydrolase protein [Mycena metata]|uniref:DNA 3'-5' helicase n=1 Tax=Mycena metata TaxID=1033252 RepID=A0AAD7I5E8_9AGAR|nr:P-loop containing nucleoside triphosphate hydrolase protein [Mycena metata]
MSFASLTLFLLLLLTCYGSFAFRFDSPEGIELARRILLDVLSSFEPHHYQMDGICRVLAGVDLVVSTPTGSGKTGYLFLSLLVMMAIAKKPSLCPSVKFPLNPVFIVVCPTNSIEQQIGTNMAELGIPALTINADTVTAARIAGEQDLWHRAREGICTLILGPEQLISQGFRALISIEAFYDRICVLGVDEIHLLVHWGLSFRKALLQIGFMHARLQVPPRTTIIGLTASLLSDTKVENAIYSLLGVNRGEFHLIRRSNARYDIQILFRRLYSGLDGRFFPELDWVLKNNDKTIIFGGTILRVFRIKCYLNSLDSANPHRDIRIRMHTGLNWPNDKLATLSDIVSDPRCQIIIATNGLAQGNDIKVIKTVIQIGEPERMEMYVQKPGRARPTATNPRGIFYISAARMQVAQKIVAQTDAENEEDAKKAARGSKSVPRMPRAVAEIITAPCKPAEQDRQYGNPVEDSPCPCRTCVASPPAPLPELCNCSGCLSETNSTELYQPPAKKPPTPSDIPKGQRLTKIEKQIGSTRLESFRLAMWMEACDREMALTPLTDFLPDIVIKRLLDCFAKLLALDDLQPYISGLKGLQEHHNGLLGIIVELRGTFKELKKANAAAKKAEKAAHK